MSETVPDTGYEAVPDTGYEGVPDTGYEAVPDTGVGDSGVGVGDSVSVLVTVLSILSFLNLLSEPVGTFCGFEK